MFGGIDEVDWAALEHAYGPAEEVPGLLHGLASDDPAMRELALDGMYATVHHQGDVYDSTLACIPFLLELVADPSVQDRGGIVELLTSIGGIDLDGDDELDLEDEEFEFAANYAMAASAITAGADVFLGLVDSDDRGVRLAVPLALATLHSEPELVLGLLRERLKVEQDPEVRFACVEAGGRIALRHDGLNPEVVKWLIALTRVPPDAQPSLYDPEAYATGPGTPGPGTSGPGGDAEPAGDPWGPAVDDPPAPGVPPREGRSGACRTPGGRPPGGPSPETRTAAPQARDGLPTAGPAGPQAPPESTGPAERARRAETNGHTGPPRLTRPSGDTSPEDAPNRDRPSHQGGPNRGRPSPGGHADAPPPRHEHPGRGGPDATPQAPGGQGQPRGRPAGAGGRSYDAGLRLSALAQLARCAPHTLPADVVPDVTGLLRELRAEPVAVPPGDRTAQPPGPTLLGQLRECREAGAAGRPAPWTGDLLRTLHSGLGDRVDDRIALLADQLCSPDRGQRIDAVRMSSGLLRTWRGEYGELVGLIGEQLTDKEPRLADAAAVALGELFELAEPAADALADFVAADPGSWVQEWASGPRMLGSAVAALARAGDRRAVPVLLRMLELPKAPRDLGYVLDRLGEAAAPLAPALRRRLGAIELDDRLYDVAGPLLYGLTALRAADAMPEVLRVLRGAPEYRREWVVELVLRALTAFGPAAREAVPDLRQLLVRAARADSLSVTFPGAAGSLSYAFGAKTAAALWAIEGDADSVLPVLRKALAATDSGARRSAAAVVGTMGPAAAVAAPELEHLLWAADPWTRVDAAAALWRVTGDPERAWPVLRAAWESLPLTRVPTAERLAERTGADGVTPVAQEAEGADVLLRAELSRVRRHNAMDGGYGSHDIVRDEKLLALCRRALTRERPTA
ncbi:hypothetical protein ACFYT4_35135 [Streptomyces sp. NPDC004609]|uniref:hypothetical protein n=1 Tax=Streptomyces sp. NPDC004609 TaxID=3364704 RepID=UPI00368ABBF1